MDSIEMLKLLSEFTRLEAAVKSVCDALKPKEPAHRSDEIKDLASALAKAQGEFTVAGKNKTNPFFKSEYADLMAVVMAARPALAKHGLSVVQDLITYNTGESVLHSILFHSTGQWIESRMRIVPPKNDIQSIASYVTYMKRMTYASLVGVLVGEEDDDGEVAMATSRDTFAKGTALNTKYNPKETSPTTISKDQREELEYELQEYPDICEQVLDGLKIQSLADMPADKYRRAIERIREIKNARNGIPKA